MEHFDESEVREIEISDRNYPELLKTIRKPPTVLRMRGHLPPNRKIIAISGSRETTQQALDAACRIGRMLAPTRIYNCQWTCPGMRHRCDGGCPFRRWQSYRCRSARTQIAPRAYKKTRWCVSTDDSRMSV